MSKHNNKPTPPKSTGRGRTRNYATIVYQDSAPPNWINLLKETFTPAFISPYHDQDINPTGEPKKPHWHVIILFDSVKYTEQAQEIFNLINGVGCEPIKSIRGYARYICHLDNPEKHQYPIDEVLQLCGADYIGTIGLPIDKYKSISEMIDWCCQEKCYSYSRLIEYCRIEKFDWFRILCDCGTMVMKEYLKSKSWTEEQKNKPF